MRVPIAYLAPWVDFGGTDKNTIDWFRHVDRERFAPSLITTQPSPNRRLDEIAEFVEETWVLPDLMAGEEMPAFILDFIASRGIEVVHLMNSRLGFDLLPDIATLPKAPGIVVQLHVEEADRSGYVRYVTTRYGNLVDRFSVTSEHLAGAVENYGVPADRVRVIYIGVDAADEFSPEKVEPAPGLDAKQLQILFPSRIVQQKDPLLMVEVARALKGRGVEFQIHVVGEGDLEEAVREKVGEYQLEGWVELHPPTATPQRWFAACDVVLLTSEFEGVPATVFEAMAMGRPVVASALPGNTELLGDDYPGLVEPIGAVDEYVEALARLAADPEGRAAEGAALRQRAREDFTLRRMAAGHEELYEEVAAARDGEGGEPEPLPEPLRFDDRPLLAQPLVSVIVPHHNQPKVLGECVDSIWTQTYPNVELIVVDDCSTATGTEEILEELEDHDDVTVVRLDRNGGPSRARNVALEHCSGRYVLPVDSDNILLPEAIERLVEQLSVAGEEVGFIYPNLQFFGNREDYYEPPEFNVYTLLHGNYVDTCSLIDRGVFDAGLRYREEIVLGHEDWEFALRLAAHGVRGERAHAPTLLYRKAGFNRSDAVDHAADPFERELEKLAPFAGRERWVKAREAPSLSLICLNPIAADPEARRQIAEWLGRQSSADVELIAPFEGEWPDLPDIPQVRCLPARPDEDPVAILRHARGLMRGAFLCVSEDPELRFLADPGFVEKALRRFTAKLEAAEAIALVDAGAEARYSFRSLAVDEFDPAAVHAIAWRRTAEHGLPDGLLADPTAPVLSLATMLSGSGLSVEWRHAGGPERADASATGAWEPAGPPGRAALTNALVQPLLPGAGAYEVPRWERTPTWIPPLSTVLIRYRNHLGSHRIVTTDPPPFGFIPERHLGALRSTSLEGTERLLRVGGEFTTVPRGEWEPVPEGGEELGYLEQAPLPQFKALAVGVYRPTGQQLLVTLPDDPLTGEVDVTRVLGFIEPFPIEPEYEPEPGPALGLVGLVKTVDNENRRHRYALGSMPEGELVGELGGLADSPLRGSIPAWIVDGRLLTDRHAPPARRADPARAARWIGETAAWRGIADGRTMAKAAARRSAIAVTRFVAPPSNSLAADDEPAGWLFEDHRHGLTPLYASYHPVTGDQLLGRSAADAAQMGYGEAELLGFIRLAAPLTGDLEQRIFPVPWARRFGAVPRSG